MENSRKDRRRKWEWRREVKEGENAGRLKKNGKHTQMKKEDKEATQDWENKNSEKQKQKASVREAKRKLSKLTAGYFQRHRHQLKLTSQHLSCTAYLTHKLAFTGICTTKHTLAY